MRTTSPPSGAAGGLAAFGLAALAGAALGLAGGLAVARPTASRAADSALHASPHARHQAGHRVLHLVRSARPRLLGWKAPRVPHVRRPAPRVIQLPPRVVTVVSGRASYAARAVAAPPRPARHEHDREGGGHDD